MGCVPGLTLVQQGTRGTRGSLLLLGLVRYGNKHLAAGPLGRMVDTKQAYCLWTAMSGSGMG